MNFVSYFLCLMASACPKPGTGNTQKYSNKMRLPPIVQDINQGSASSVFKNDVLKLPAGNRTRTFRPGRFSGTDLAVDVLLLLDYSLYKMFAKNYQDVPEDKRKQTVVDFMKEYYGLTFSAIAQRYDEANFQLDGKKGKIRPRLNGLFIATSKDEDTFSEPKAFKLSEWSRRKSVDSGEILDSVANWFKKRQEAGEYKNIDHVMLITGNDITMMGPDPDTGKRGRISNAVGVAFKGEVCNKLTVSANEEDMRFQVVGTAAHELGHNLGADHDGEGEGKSCNSAKHFIMNAGVTYGNDKTFMNQYKFSKCSMHSMSKVFKKLNSVGENCMADTGPQDPELKKLTNVIPGFKYDLHQQCKIFMQNKDSYFCRRNANEELEGICRKPKCFNPKHKFCGDFLGNNHVLPGTPCGKDKWCMNGDCVKAPIKIPTTEHGCVMEDSPKCDTYTKLECERWGKMCCNKCAMLKGK